MAQRNDTELPVPRPAPEPELSFPDVPRLELDQLLGQLVDRAHEVMGTQGRLRGLLHANQLVTSDLTSATVLQRTAEAARELLGARTAHLQLGDDAGTGRGPVRRPPASGGRPDLDLDVTVCVRGEEIGVLHLADSDHGGFTAEDRELAQALAATAGMAIQNARLYESARRRGEWLQASAAITREILADRSSGARTQELVARSSRDVAGADVVALLRPDPDGAHATQLCVDVLVGSDEDELLAQVVPLAGTLLGEVFHRGEPTSLPGGELGGGAGPMPWAGLTMGPVLAVPLVASGTVRGVLCAGRRPGRPVFSATDTEMAAGFANQAAVALELADARAEKQRAIVLDERERIAADLHDNVVQRLFGVGLALQGVLADVGQGRAADRLRGTVQEIDRTINRIRSALFPLQAPGRSPDPRDRVLDAVADAIPALGFEPDLRFAGLVAGTVAADVVEDLVVVVHETLLDVARRGRASTAAVDVVEDRDGLVVHVRDDDLQGAGTASATASEEPHRRASEHGGSFTVTGSATGTSQYWWVPRA